MKCQELTCQFWTKNDLSISQQLELTCLFIVELLFEKIIIVYWVMLIVEVEHYKPPLRLILYLGG